MTQVDSEDAAFLFLEQADNPAHLGLVALYDQSGESHVIRFQHILKHIHNRLNSAPVFHQKLKRVPGDLDYPYWVEDDGFDLEYHVRHLALPSPGDWRQFCIQVSRLHSRPLDVRRPLWELYVIEGLDRLQGLPEGSFALYFKIHHCAMDEFTAIELLESLHQSIVNTRQHENRATPIMVPAPRVPGGLDIFAQMVAGNLVRGLKFSLQSLKNRNMIAQQLLKSSARRVSRWRTEDEVQTRFAASPGPARVFDGRFYHRDVFERFIALVPGANIQHALAVICGEATRLYVADNDGHELLQLSAQLQLNLRNAGAHALSGNKLALQRIDLYTEVENLVERLYAIVGSNVSANDTELEIRSHTLRAFYENMPAPLLSLIGHWSKRELRALEEGGSCGISMLSGPAQPAYFLGAKMSGLISVSALYKGCGLMYAASQYQDKISISCTSGRDILPDPENLIACLEQTMATVASLGSELAAVS